VTAIGDNAFYNNTAVTSVTVPNSVTSIGVAAFEACRSLTNLTIPDSVVNLGDGVCSSCFGLTSLVIGNSVVNVGIQAFNTCGHLTSVQIPDSVTNIDKLAFYECSSLTNLVLGRNVGSIGYWSFKGCSSLTSIIIPSSVSSIGYEAFTSCPNLRQLYFWGNAPFVSGGDGVTLFLNYSGTVYYLPGTTGWGSTFGVAWPTAEWYQPQPQILGSGYGLGVQSNGFQFTVSWATNTAVVVEASTNLQNWTPVITNTLVNGTNAFSDSKWTNYSRRFYRVRSQ
jgi:hypothetical protein